MEFILIFAFSLVIIIPLINYLYSEFQDNRQVLDTSQAQQVLDEISLKAQNTYYSGFPSRTTLEMYVPRGITSVESNWNKSGTLRGELVFKVQQGSSSSDLVATFPFPINTSPTPMQLLEGKRKIMIKVEWNSIVNITEAK